HRIALAVFRYQAENNPLYRRYLHELKVNPETVSGLEDIPFTPISFFKTHDIQSDVWAPEAIFKSSGTTGSVQSRHLVASESDYLHNTKRCFEHFFDSL